MRTIIAVLACLWAAGCAVEDGAGPAPTAPSEFGLSVTLIATPDQLPRDGRSQSVVTVTVRDAAGRPVSGQRMSVAASAGTLSESEVVTGNEGRVSFALVAPASGTVGGAAVVQVVPFGTNADDAVPRTVSILLTGVSNRTLPTPSFSFTPSAPQANQAVRFDASATTDEGAVCLDACTYRWDFGNGSTGAGRVVSHI